jgi:lipoyl(octanoyl) transferase
LTLISLVQLGTIDYATGLRLQQRLVALRKEEKIGDVLLLLEHSPVITLGRNAKAGNVVASPEFLKQRGVELFECDRGGDVTFHGPGQIVGYPIFDLRGFARATSLSSRAEENDSTNRSLQSRGPGVGLGGSNHGREGHAFSRAEGSIQEGAASAAGVKPRKHLGAVDFVRRLEEVLIRTCADFAIPTKRVPGLTGVWTDFDLKGRGLSRAAGGPQENAALAAEDHEAKLAAIGVHISRFVTSHGFALNVNPDLSYFNLIIPCGITSKPVTSMQKELGRPLDLNSVAESISRNFGVVFQSQILWVESLDALLGPCGPGACLP